MLRIDERPFCQSGDASEAEVSGRDLVYKRYCNTHECDEHFSCEEHVLEKYEH